MTDQPISPAFRVVIAGGGVAALETAFALRALAHDRLTITLVTPDEEFHYRPLSITEPFNRGTEENFSLAALADLARAEVIASTVTEVDQSRRQVITDDGAAIPYGALVVATGATPYPRFAHTTTIDAAHTDELLHGLVLDLEQGYLHRLAIVVPAPPSWPFPAYELALMAAERGWDMQTDAKIVLLTPERLPLEMFGQAASAEVAALLDSRGIELVTSAFCEVPRSKQVIAHPSGRLFEADRIIALPQLRGPALKGLPHDGGGFLPVDDFGSVRGTDRVWAAGDATDHPIKQGGVAAGLADVIARGIASMVGAPVVVRPYVPAVRGILLTGGQPRYLCGRPAWPGPRGESVFSEEIPEDMPAKIAARYLTPALRELSPSTLGLPR